ncbi:LuxR family transcriptional regulator [Pelagicola sp. LXJ1103]|nr:LuxR family transcriptional regulator [Pelagicola sp. LXJ1103]
MVFSTNKLAQAIAQTGKPDFYWALIDLLRSILPFDSVVVLIFKGENTPVEILHKAYGHDVFRLLESDYLAASYLLDPVYQLHAQGAEAGIYRLMEIAPDHFQRSKYFKWYYGRIGMLEEIVIFLPVNEDTTITISLGKDFASKTPFSPRLQKNLAEFEDVIYALMRSDWKTRKTIVRPSSQDRGSLVSNLQRVTETRHGIKLTNRQAEVGILILRGHSTPSIAATLDLSPQTIKVFRRQLYAKCNISSQSALFMMMLPIIKEISAFE